MAKQVESEDFKLVSGARSGMKRELAFALKSQADWSGSTGRTRGKKMESMPNGDGDEASENPSSKRFKKSTDSNVESQIDLVEKENVQIDGSLKVGEEKWTCNEESKLDSMKLEVVEEPRKELEESVMGESVLRENSCREEGKAEVPTVIDDIVEGQNDALEKPMKRFTRSSLKPNEESLEVSAIATSSGSTVVSEEASKNESTAISPLKTSSKDTIGKKIKLELNKHPTNVKELLNTGFLEGLTVQYIFRSKKNQGLSGVIKDGSILCSCNACQGCQAVTAYQFEKHAGSTNKYPAMYIYLENGMSLREMIDACKSAPLEELEETIKDLVSSKNSQSSICKSCKEPLSAYCTTKMASLCGSCLVSENSHNSPSHVPSKARLQRPVSATKSSGCVSEPASSHTKSKGKLTRKDLRLHKLVFEEDGLPDGTELAYYIHGKKIIEGYKKGLGIFCRHCEREVSPSQFEAHAGNASRRKPYLNIYTSNGVSLHELSVSLSRARKLSNHENDDLCSYCADYGDLLCCDTCPRAFHQDCVGLPSVPDDKWYCPYCISMYEREKSCEYNENAKAAGRVSGVDPIEQIKRRCIRIVETTETEIGGCILCRRHEFSKSEFGPSTVILCDQCEKEYHVGCLKDHKMADLKELPKGKWFCCADCKRIYTVLKMMAHKKHEILPSSLLDIIKKKQEQKYPNEVDDCVVSWRILNGQTATPGSKLLLSKAIAIFHEQFDPIVDANTGLDLIPAMVYGRSIRDQDFGGMYCAVLMVDSTVVSAAILRIFGQDTAEIPLVATTSETQGRGYFQCLYTCMERLLGFLTVRMIVLPSAAESKSIWTDRFGYRMIPPDQLTEFRNRCQLMTFQGTSMLYKPVPKVRIVDKPTTGQS